MPILPPSALAQPIPNRARLFGWLLVLPGLVFADVYWANPGSVLPGVTVETFSDRSGLSSTGVQIPGSVLGILVAYLFNDAERLALMLLTRVFIEFGDPVVGVVPNGGPDANTMTLLVLASVELQMLFFFVARLRRG